MVVSYPLAATAQYPQNGHTQQSSQQYRPNPSMDSGRPGASDYTSTAPLPSNSYQYSTGTIDTQNGDSSASTPQHASTVPDSRSNYSSSATPTSETGAIYSGRTAAFASDQIRYVDGSRYQPSNTTSTGGMAQNVPTSTAPAVKADPEVSEEPAVAAPAPAFAPPAHYGSPQYQAGPHPTMAEGGYQSHPGTPNQAWRTDWGPYGPPPLTSPYGHPSSPTTMAGPPGLVSTARPVPGQKPNRKRVGDQPTNHPLSQVYSFVPIPGATQNKRPRRRYEEIERMYKCGWKQCEKAYGTLNHLNAHVTMQGHGTKRTPDEFKEIRKEWKARKKEEEAQRKAQEEEQRRRAQEDPTVTTSGEPQSSVAGTAYVAGMTTGQRQLPPPLAYPNVTMASNGVHYTPTNAPTAPMENIQQYTQQPMYTGYAGTPQYAGQPQQIYTGQQRAATTQSNGNTNTTTGGEEPDADAEPDPDIAAAPTYSS